MEDGITAWEDLFNAQRDGAQRRWGFDIDGFDETSPWRLIDYGWMG